MNNKKKSMIITAISMISVFIMIVWGTLSGSYEHAWLAVFAGGIAITIVSMFFNAENKKDNNTNDND